LAEPPYDYSDTATIHKTYLTAALSVSLFRKHPERRIRAALKATVYSVPKCPHTAKLKEFLKSKDVQVEEKCVLDSPQIMKEMIDISKQRGMPVTVIGEDVFVGFDSLVERRITRKLGGR